MLLLITSIRSDIVDGRGLDQHHIDIIIWMLDLLFSQMKEDEFDPLLEQAYHKLAGYWPVDKPWYERVKDGKGSR